ncbi:MAG: hypothetical protein PHQ57_00145 [Candidatus Omnitrophica bacterium]|nr:hypothetical protein [Candidatus Omnitrophota bacterium]
MRKCRVVLAGVGLFILLLAQKIFAGELEWQDISMGNTGIKTVLVNAENNSIIYAGSDKGIFMTEDGGEAWKDILVIGGKNKAVNYISADLWNKNSLYVATGNGFFISSNQGKNWKRLFRGKNYLESECTVSLVLSEQIYLGTKAGLFISRDKGRSWHKAGGRLKDSPILAIASNMKEPQSVYVACIDGLFRTKDNGDSWERIFVAGAAENSQDVDIEEQVEDRDGEERISNIRYISCDPNNADYIYLATSKVIYKSSNKGQEWEKLSDYGLLSRDVRFLSVSQKSEIYVVTKSGIFEYKSGRWFELSFGLPDREINFLAIDSQANLYAACGKGLFKTNMRFDGPSMDKRILTLYSGNEPEIKDIHAAAIRYAEVDPEKIILWRKQAAKKALLPKISVGVGRNVTDLWHWETGSSIKNGDDVLTRGKDAIEWDTTLSWDLSELIWNPDQASIDARSRLMVELRGDILDEVNKLYFERLRVKMELDKLSIEDSKRRLEKELRLQELTASLDALTGGYFSSQLKPAQTS